MLVGLYVERTLEMLIGLVGILKAGAAYVPLDPGYPPERLAYMIADARVPVLLTQARLAPDLPAAGRPRDAPPPGQGGGRRRRLRRSGDPP